jgi:hypothetical protein
MRKLSIALAVGLMLGVGLIAAPSLYAQDDQAPSGQKSGPGMMRDGMMGGGMGGMMNMMQQMGRMMEHCNTMMSGMSGDGRARPNDNWRKDAPATPEKRG